MERDLFHEQSIRFQWSVSFLLPDMVAGVQNLSSSSPPNGYIWLETLITTLLYQVHINLTILAGWPRR